IAQKSEQDFNGVELLNSETGKSLGRHKTASHQIEQTWCMSGNGEFLAIRPPDKRDQEVIIGPEAVVEVWEVKTDRAIARLQTDAGDIKTMGFSPDGKKLVV